MSAPYERSTYEGDGGWADGRLGQAYDLIDEVCREWPQESGPADSLRAMLCNIENTDIEIWSLK